MNFVLVFRVVRGSKKFFGGDLGQTKGLFFVISVILVVITDFMRKSLPRKVLNGFRQKITLFLKSLSKIC
jgi:hypothetical protein